MSIKRIDNFYVATVGNMSFYAFDRMDAMKQASAYVWGLR